MSRNYLTWFVLVCIVACGEKTKKENLAARKPDRVINVPVFNSDSCYYYIKKQVDFGPRIPNTKAHKQAGDYFINTFKRLGAQLSIQEFEGTSYDGQRLSLRNIVASYFPDKKKEFSL